MGDMHNLFGRVNEAEVILGPEGHAGRDGRPARRAGERDPGACFGYDGSDLAEAVKVQLERADRTAARSRTDDAARVPASYTIRRAAAVHLSRLTATEQAPRRHLGLADATAVYAGIILGSGIFVAPAAIAGAVPSIPAACGL